MVLFPSVCVCNKQYLVLRLVVTLLLLCMGLCRNLSESKVNDLPLSLLRAGRRLHSVSSCCYSNALTKSTHIIKLAK